MNILSQAVTPWPPAATSLSSSPYAIKFSLSPNSSSSMPPHSSTSYGCRCSCIEEHSFCHRSMSSNGRRQNRPYSVSPEAPATLSSVEDLFEFICSGPLIDKLGLTPEKVVESIDKWLTCGSQLSRLFQLNDLNLNDAQKVRFYHYYIPVYLWCENQISQHASTFKDGEEVPPLVWQGKLREANSGNKLLEFRGNAGSHDLPLSVETLTAMSKLTKEGGKMKIPRYDKSAYNGRGDRADPSTWPEIEGPLTAILFEGWMLGFKPVENEVVKAVDPQLEIVNKNLQAYYDAWDKFVKAWIVIKIKDPSCVYQWRLQAEQAMRADGLPGMSDEEVMDFVSRYLPAYNAYLPTLYSEGPNGSDPKRTLIVEIDEGRNPILAN